MSDPVLDLLVRYEDETLADKSPWTVQTHAGALLRFARWIQPRSVLEVTTGDLVNWLDASSLSPETRARRIGAVHRFYNWLLNDGLVDRDPAAPLTRLRQPILTGELPGLLHNWRIAQERKNLAQSTITMRLHVVRLFFDWLAPKPIADASSEDIEAFLDSRGRCGDPLGPKSRYASISNLHVFYTWCLRQGITTDDPTENIDRPRVPIGVPRPIADEDLVIALDRADPRVRAVLTLAAFGGLRAKEIAGLRREDILDHLTPPIIVITAPKGHRQRTVPLHPKSWEALEAYGMPRSGHVFGYPNGRPWPAWRVSEVANHYLAGLGISASLHKLRHFFATKVYAASLDLRLTQELLGHSSPSVTAIYTAYNRNGAAEAVCKVAAVGG